VINLQDITLRWLSALGISTALFGISLVVFHIPVRTIAIFVGIGLGVVALWLYSDARSQQQKRLDAMVSSSEGCICAICKHEEAKVCLQKKCMCCIVMKGNSILGHTINPLQ